MSDSASAEGRRHLVVGERYWYGRPVDRTSLTVQGMNNFRYVTHEPRQRDGHPFMERGVNRLRCFSDGGSPQLTLVTKAHRAGSESAPWHDRFDVSRGVARYFGDAKLQHRVDGVLPTDTPGNRVLLHELRKAQSPDPAVRRRTAPVMCMRQVESSVYEFLGLAVLQSASHVTQLEPVDGAPFPNLVYDLALLDLSPEGLRVDWAWINARRAGIDSASESQAPQAWKVWVEVGNDDIDRVRTVAASPPTRSKMAQLPEGGSRAADLLSRIYSHFHGRKHEFEFLAAAIVEQLLSETGIYRHGWVTRRGGDFGLDFVGALTVGVPPAATDLVLLGQAKCEAPTRPTSATHVARTVSRLRRGWIAGYVTTSFFTTATQREVSSDEYPIIMVSGLEVAQTVDRMMRERHVGTLDDLMATISRRVRDDPPETVLGHASEFGWDAESGTSP